MPHHAHGGKLGVGGQVVADDSMGLSMTGAAEAVASYNRAVGHLIRFQPAVADAAAASVAVDPGCVMGRVLGAYLGLMSTEEGAVADARAALAHPSARTARAASRACPPRRRPPLGSGRHGRGGRAPSATSPCVTRETCSLSSSATRSTSSVATPSISGTGSAGRCSPGTTKTRDPLSCTACTPLGWRSATSTASPPRLATARWRLQPRRRVGHPRGRAHLRDGGAGTGRSPLHARAPRRLDRRQLPQRPQLLALRALPASGGRHRGRARRLRPVPAPRRVR